MSEINITVASQPLRQRRRPSSSPNVEGSHSAATTTSQTKGLADISISSGSSDADIVLSLRDENYQRVMWRQFNLLGTLKDSVREENAALEVFTLMKDEGVRFYKVERGTRGGKRSRAKEEEALEKITSDIKRRTEFAHKWLKNSATTDIETRSKAEVPTVSDHSDSSGEKIFGDVYVHGDKSTSSAECLDSGQAKMLDSNTAKRKPESKCILSLHSPSASVFTSQDPNKNDTILSLYDPKYSDVMIKSYQQLGKDSSEKKDKGIPLINKLEKEAGRFFKEERDGQDHVEENQDVVLQKGEDISRRNETSKRWQAVQEEQDKSLSVEGEAVVDYQTIVANSPTYYPQEEMTKTQAINSHQTDKKQASVTVDAQLICQDRLDPTILVDEVETAKCRAVTLKQTDTMERSLLIEKAAVSTSLPQEAAPKSCPAVLPQRPEVYQAHITAIAAAHSSSQESPHESQVKEKNQDNHDLGSLSALKSQHGAGSSSTGEPKLNHNVRPFGEIEPNNDHESPSEEKTKSEENSSEAEKRPLTSVILSLNDDHYREIMWRHYRILGKARDNDKEAEIGHVIFSSFKEKMGGSGKFFKRAHDQEIEVNDEKALSKIIADIRRRMKNYRKWSGAPEKPIARLSSNSLPGLVPTSAEQSSLFSRSMSLRGHPSNVSTHENGNATLKTSPRRSARKPIASEITKNDPSPSDEDIILSLNHETYRDVMWKQYNILGKKHPGDDKSKEEDVANNVFKSLKENLGRGGRFFKKMSHGDLLFIVDDEGAMRKITRDLKRRNECSHKWFKIGGIVQLQDQPLLPPKEDPRYNPPLPIKQEHAWRDQLVPSPIEMVTNVNSPAQTTQVNTHLVNIHSLDNTNPVDTHPVDILPVVENVAKENSPPLMKPSDSEKKSAKANHGHESNAQSAMELLMSSHLGQRLPPLTSLRCVKSVHTPNQLIHLLQHATHKLNELNRANTKHGKMLRLYNLSEFNGASKTVVAKTLSIPQLAEYMETTPKSLKKWYMMYRNAVLRGFDFARFGDHKIRDYHAVFFAVEECYKISKCAVRTLGEYFQGVGTRVVGDVKDATEGKIIHPRKIFAKTSGIIKGSDWETKFAAPPNQNIYKRSSEDHSLSDLTGKEYHHPLYNHNNPFLRNLQKNEARLLALTSATKNDSSSKLMGIKLSSVAKRVKRGTKDRMLCMVVGCVKHAQTKCDGCCTSHFRTLSSTTVKNEKLPSGNKFELRKAESSVLLGKQKARKIDSHPSLPTHNSLLTELETGSRIYVEWDGDNNLYKATVKKIFFDRGAPMVKIHYDGKKRHILNTIPLEMVKNFIEEENHATKQKGARQDAPSVNTSRKPANDTNLTNSLPLYKLHSGTVPLGKSEIMQTCSEIGTGWHVQVLARQGLVDGHRNDQISISPTGEVLARQGLVDGHSNDEIINSPTGEKSRSVVELENNLQKNPNDVEGLTRDCVKMSQKKTESEGLDEECNELSAINQSHLIVQPSEVSNLNMKPPDWTANFPAKHFLFGNCDPKLNGTRQRAGMRPLNTFSPMKTRHSGLSDHLSLSEQPGHSIVNTGNAQAPPQHEIPSSSFISQSKASYSSPLVFNTSLKHSVYEAPTNKNGVHSPKEVAHLNSAFSSPAETIRPPLHHQLYQALPVTSNSGHFPGLRNANIVKLQRNGPTCVAISSYDAPSKELGRCRPKRKLKPSTRFEERGSPLSCPTAVVGGQSKSVLCHCPDCDKGDLTVQGMYAHYGRAHKGKLIWENVTYSCPFCPSSTIFTSFNGVEAHANASHPGYVTQGPHPPKIARQSQSHLVPKSDRVLRERKTIPQVCDYVVKEDLNTALPQADAEKQYPPPWTKIEYLQLLHDGRKDYPRNLCRVIDMIDEQCQIQDETVEVAHEQRMKVCRSETDLETRVFYEERLSYQRGVRERARLADGERIEKQKFMEKADQMMMRYQYENRNRRRNQEDIEVEKLWSRAIKFSNEAGRHNTRQGKSCKDNQCQFCRKDKAFLHHLLLDSEISKFKLGAPATQSPVFQQPTKVLNPSFRKINDDFFSEAESAGDFKHYRKGASSGSKRVNQSRRDASTAKRLKMEVGKLWMLQNTKHSLEFIKKYNEGVIMNAWGETKKDHWGRKSY